MFLFPSLAIRLCYMAVLDVEGPRSPRLVVSVEQSGEAARSFGVGDDGGKSRAHPSEVVFPITSPSITVGRLGAGFGLPGCGGINHRR